MVTRASMRAPMRAPMWALLIVVGAGCGSRPPPRDDVVVRVRVRDDLCPPGGCDQSVPDEDPFCDPPGPDGLQVVDLAAGYAHACAVTTDGRVRCWGRNHEGGLGDGSHGRSATPVLVRDVRGATAVVTGRMHSCALVEGGRVWCWGTDDSQQIGDRGSSGPAQSIPAEVPGLRDVAQITSGWDHTCALTQRGQVFCWGVNRMGQLGDGSRRVRGRPVPVRGVRATHIAAGHDTTCAATVEGAVACWGGLAGSDRPMLVHGLPPAAATVAVGDGSACALLRDGSVHCWGDGTHGQLGSAEHGTSESPVRVEGLPPVLALAHRGTRACALDAQGQLLCWGANEAFVQDAAEPRTVAMMGPAAAAAIGDRATCARMRAGGVCCWGDNIDGVLGTLLHPFSSPSEHSEAPVPLAW